MMPQKNQQNVSNVCNHQACSRQGQIPQHCLNGVAAGLLDGKLCMAVQINQLQALHARQAASLFDGDLAKAMLVLEVANRHPVAQVRYHRYGERFAFSNIHSLAEASGIPRETVRRKVGELMSAGWLLRLADGGLVLCRERLSYYLESVLPQQVAHLSHVAERISALQAAMAMSAPVAE